MEGLNYFWNSLEEPQQKTSGAACADCGGPLEINGCEDGHCEEGAGFHAVPNCKNCASAAKGDHINPRPGLWDMRGDGALITKPMGRSPGGQVIVAAPGTCDKCDSSRTNDVFIGPAHRGPICGSSCYDHCTKSGHY